MRRALAISIILVAALSVAPAAEREEGFVMGVGMSSCAEFARDYKRNPDTYMAMYLSWAQGFMSAINFLKRVTNKPPHNLNGLTLTDQQMRLQFYCDQNPLKPFFYAAQDLWDALPETKH